MNGELNRSPENIGVESRKGLADIQACEGKGGSAGNEGKTERQGTEGTVWVRATGVDRQ